MRQFDKVVINLSCEVSSEKGHMISITISLDTEPDQDPMLFSDPDPLKQRISEQG
jgi:hypothetical protein